MLRKYPFSLVRQRWVYPAAVLYAFGILYVASHFRSVFENASPAYQKKSPGTSKIQLPSIAHALDVFRHPITAPNLTLVSGETFLLPYPSSPHGHRFQKSLGKAILILDTDTRPLNSSGELLNSTWAPNEMNLWATTGRLNHYLFAQLHGYDYKFVRMTFPPGVFGTWSKVSAIREQLHHYKFVVFLDSDTIFPHPHVPLEWLFNYWDIVPENLVAMAVDPSYPINNDLRGRTMLNTGFLIAQRSPRAHELFQAWESCPQEVKYLGCSNFSYTWPHEQGAFGNFLRYDFNRPDDVKTLKCSEANGCPEVAHLGCTGKLVRHYWGSKASVASAVQQSIVQYFLSSLHLEFHNNYNDIVLSPPNTSNISLLANKSPMSSVSQSLESEIPAPVQEGLQDMTEGSSPSKI